MHLTESTWTDAEASTADVALVPVGSTEQHGPHAPLGTDTLAAEAIAAEGATRTSHEVVVAPPIPVGVAAEHRQFAGTLWVSEDTLRAYVAETIESLAHHGWERVVVVNGHGGNVAPLQECCARLTREGGAYAVAFTWFDAVSPVDVGFDGQMGHGGPIETSLLQYLHAELVDEQQFAAAAETGAATWGEYVAGTPLSYDSIEFTESGAVGDPGEGSAALGERLFDRASDRLVELVDAVAERNL